jgi:hypothetical protein
MTPSLASGRILIVIFSSNVLLSMVAWEMYETPLNIGVVTLIAVEERRGMNKLDRSHFT